MGPDTRHQESVHLRRQRLRYRRRGESHADHCGSGAAPSRVHRARDESAQHLSRRITELLSSGTWSETLSTFCRSRIHSGELTRDTIPNIRWNEYFAAE